MNHKDRFLYRRALSTVVVLLFCTINTTLAQTTLSAEDIAEKALAATVYLEMKDKNGKTLGFGSGFFVKPNIIATNYHVIEGAAKGTAKLVGKYTTYNIEGVTATDRDSDLALLKVTAYGIRPLSLGESDTVRIGETVYVAGNPKGLEGTFSDGIISSRRDRYTNEHLQMTAPISPGSSGGPVLNRKGEVIGVSFMTIVGGQNLNFAIPSKYLKRLLTYSSISRPLGQSKVIISAETYFTWGYAKEGLGNYKGAIADYTDSIQLESNNFDAYYNRGNVRAKLGQYASAVADYNIAIRLKPNHAPVYYNRGNAKYDLGQYNDAITDYDTAIRLKPDYASVYNNRGNTRRKLEQYFAAITDYDTAIRLDPNDALTYYNRGNAKYDLGQYNAAVADYDTTIRLKPDYANVYCMRGKAKSALGQDFAAITDYDTAIQLKPDYADAYTFRGLAKYGLGQYFAAITDYDTAIQLKPSYVEAYTFRGLAKAALGQDSAAITDYDTAIQLNPNAAFAYYERGLAKGKLGRIWEAKQDLQTGLKLAEQGNDESLKTMIKEVLRLLE